MLDLATAQTVVPVVTATTGRVGAVLEAVGACVTATALTMAIIAAFACQDTFGMPPQDNVPVRRQIRESIVREFNTALVLHPRQATDACVLQDFTGLPLSA